MPITRQQAASNAKFAYSQLDRALTTSFRIVTLFPDDHHSPVLCTLSHEDWRSPVASYEAISYFWGDRKQTQTILINGKNFFVTSNLESALRHLRHGEQGQPLRFWIDAICINQADTHERSEQVRQMFHIYNRAERVIVWLGNATSDSNKALDFIKTSLGPCFESVGFSSVDEQTNVASGFWEEWDEGKDTECYGAIDHLMTQRHAKSWSSVAELFCRPWWSRAWVVQELISAQKATITCGTLSVPWPLLDMTIQMMLRNTKIEELYGQRKWDLFHNAVEDAYGLAYERSHRVLDGTDALDFVMLMQITRYRDCQDPRDKVFSVLSLLSEDFQANFYPDYLQHVETVYAGAVRSHVQHASDLHLLSSCFLSKQATLPSAPSWVPNWGRAFEMSYLGGYSAKDTDYSYGASGKIPATVSFSEDLKILTVSGLHIDYVEDNRLQETDEDFDYSYSEGPGQEEPSCSWDIHKIVAGLETLGKSVITRKREPGVLKAVCQTLIVDRDSIRGKRRQNMKLTKQHNRLWPENLYDYLAHVRLWSQERSLILSHGGYIGLAPSSTLPGDKICILHGFHAPVILRQRAESSYVFVGDAYVHALMDGEAVAPRNKTKFQSEEFEIR
jgi:Heterokaryon incompatibility protein (HET)